MQPRLPSRFKLRRSLGDGQEATVLAVFDVLYRQEVAVKLLRGAGPDELYRLKREFRSLSSHRHPNVVQYYELFVEPVQFITMEPIDGRPLSGPLPAAAAARLLLQLAQGLHSLHQHGIVHRDLKPDNVLLENGTGRVVLIDLGFVARVHQAEGPGLIGTPAYLPPEQFFGHPPGPQTDWYAFGCLLHELVFGQHPFDLPDSSLIRAKLAGCPALPGRLPTEVDALLRRLLAARPQDRPDGAEVCRALAAWAGDATSTPPQRPPFVGRAQELAELDRIVAQAAGPQVVVVTGPPGIGKSRLVDEWCGRSGRPVLKSRCDPCESVLFNGLDAIIDDLSRLVNATGSLDTLLPAPQARALVRLFPVLARCWDDTPQALATPADPLREKQLGIRALNSVLTAVLDDSTVLCIDDLQWADDDSLELLRQLGPAMSASNRVLLCTARDAPGPLARARDVLLQGALTVIEVPVGPLEDHDARALLRRLDTDHAAPGWLEEAAGSPLLLSQLAHHPGQAPGSLSALLLHRLDRLDPGEREVATMLCVMGAPSPVSALQGARQLVRSGLFQEVVVSGRAMVAPFHDRLRETVLDTLTGTDVRRAHHARAAAVLAEADDPRLELRLLHHHAAGQRPAAADCARRAADLAANGLAFERAARLFREAIELADTPDPHLHTRLGDALAALGLSQQSADAFARAAELHTGRPAIDLRLRATEQVLHSARPGPGMQMLAGCMAEVGVPWPSVARAMGAVLWWRLWLAVFGAGLRARTRPGPSRLSPQQAHLAEILWIACAGLSLYDQFVSEYFGLRHLRMVASDGGAQAVRGWAYESCYRARAMGLPGVGDLGALELARWAVAWAEQHGDDFDLGHTKMCLSCVHWFHHDNAETLRLSVEAEAHFKATRRGRHWEINAARVWRNTALMYGAHIEQGIALIEDTVADATLRGDIHVYDSGTFWGISLFRLAQDRPEDARKAIAPTLRRRRDGLMRLADYSMGMAWAQVWHYLGRPDRAWSAMQRWDAAARRTGGPMVPRLQIDLEFNWGLAACAARSRLPQHKVRLEARARKALARIRRIRIPAAQAYAAMLDAGMAQATGAGDLLDKLKVAALTAERLDQTLLAMLARVRLEQLGHGEGAVEALRQRGMVAPERFVGVVLPPL